MNSINDTSKAMDNLQAGDHFHEMFAHHVFVLSRDGNRLKVLVAHSPCELPKDGKVAELSIERFKKFYAYTGRTEGYWVTYSKNIGDPAEWLEEFANLPLFERFFPDSTPKIDICKCCKRPL